MPKNNQMALNPFDDQSYQIDQHNIEVVHKVEELGFVVKLFRFVHFCEWMNKCVFECDVQVRALIDVLEEAYLNEEKCEKSVNNHHSRPLVLRLKR